MTIKKEQRGSLTMLSIGLFSLLQTLFVLTCVYIVGGIESNVEAEIHKSTEETINAFRIEQEIVSII